MEEAVAQYYTGMFQKQEDSNDKWISGEVYSMIQAVD
jgi:hypothetical protein